MENETNYKNFKKREKIIGIETNYKNFKTRETIIGIEIN